MVKLEADRSKQPLDSETARAKAYKEIAETVKTEYQLILSGVAPADYRTKDKDKMVGDEHDRIEVFFACIEEAVNHHANYFKDLGFTGMHSRAMMKGILQEACGNQPARYARDQGISKAPNQYYPLVIEAWTEKHRNPNTSLSNVSRSLTKAFDDSADGERSQVTPVAATAPRDIPLEFWCKEYRNAFEAKLSYDALVSDFVNPQTIRSFEQAIPGSEHVGDRYHVTSYAGVTANLRSRYPTDIIMCMNSHVQPPTTMGTNRGTASSRLI
eukprot:COSAG02_NODE_7676_length_2898_cov_31.313683_2_plen_270_part_00